MKKQKQDGCKKDLFGGPFLQETLKLILILTVLVMLSGCGEKEADAGESENTEAEETMSVETEAMKLQEPAPEDTVPMEDVTAGEAAAESSGAVPVSADVVPSGPDTVSENEAGGEEEPSEEEEPEQPPEGIFTSEPVPDEVFARMSGVSFPADCTIAREDLRYLRLSYNDFKGQTRLGELVCNKKIAGDMIDIFSELYKRGYQIEKMKLIDDYGGDDDLSCADNNTSCFNYRTVAGSNNLSKHAMGIAIDINPFYNPYVTYPGGVEHISPPGSEPYADRSSDFPHKIGPGDDAYELFTARGYTWGGNWKTMKDYQHFQKAK